MGIGIKMYIFMNAHHLDSQTFVSEHWGGSRSTKDRIKALIYLSIVYLPWSF